MSEETQSAKSGWTSVQVYTLSVLCLLVGVALGYLYRGSAATSTTASSVAAPAMQPQIPQGGAVSSSMPSANPGAMPGGNPSAMPAAPAQPSPEQMKQMAEQKVAPLLEQLKANPNDTELLTRIGTFYLAAGQFDQSAKYFEKVTVIKPTADAWVKLSNAQAYGGAGEKAIASLNKALALDPKSANALYNLGMLKWQVGGDVKGAIACWEKLVATNPNHPQINQVKQLIAHARQQLATQATQVKP